MNIKLFRFFGYLILIATIMMTGTPLNSKVDLYFATRYYDIEPGWITIIICALGIFLVKNNNFTGLWAVVGANSLLALFSLVIVLNSELPIGPAIPAVIALTLVLAYLTFKATEHQSKLKEASK